MHRRSRSLLAEAYVEATGRTEAEALRVYPDGVGAGGDVGWLLRPAHSPLVHLPLTKLDVPRLPRTMTADDLEAAWDGVHDALPAG